MSQHLKKNAGAGHVPKTPTRPAPAPPQTPEQQCLVDVFFNKALPAPESDYLNDFDSSQVPNAFKALVMGVMQSPWFENPDHKDLAEGIIKASRFGGNVLELALAKLIEFSIAHPPSTKDRTPKAGHLRYLRWAATGRKDHRLPSASDEQRNNPPDYSLLPEFDDSEKTCARCNKKGANVHCERCVVETEGRITLATFYCSRKCLKHHTVKHRPSCDTMIQFHRSMSMFHELFPMVFEAADDPRDVPQEISRDPNGMIKVELPSPQQVQNLAVRGALCLGPVPCKEEWNRAMFKTVLLRGSCNEVLTSMRPFLDLFFQPFVKCVEVIRVFPKNMAEAVYETKPDYVFYRTTGTHTIIMATLPDNTKIIVDVSGAQYGWKEFMAPCARYVKNRVCRTRGGPVVEQTDTKVVDEFESKRLWNHLFGRRDEPSWERHLTRDRDPKEEADEARTKLSVWMTISLADAIKGRYECMKSMLALNEENFKEARVWVMAMVKSLLDQHNRWLAGRQDYRLFLPPQPDGTLDVVKVATMPHLCGMMQRIWLTKDQVDSMSGPAPILEYRKRLRDMVNSHAAIVTPSGSAIPGTSG
ncbi:hypothetical protein QBC37DRAFT_204159 [Rhypophila decipiens]|uniref:Uncharacterized protein n=1 Tax=Rhypophila decipiens TaxID=261697 RepID=A0AAN6Y5T2_9PEZI|nr:hypothetical protein QBC37DRAFT_204159 [Rhypophila decipiens]